MDIRLYYGSVWVKTGIAQQLLGAPRLILKICKTVYCVKEKVNL